MLKDLLSADFPELKKLASLIEEFGDRARVRVLSEVPFRDKKFPIHCIEIGSQKKTDPVIFFVAGVHGLERIGCQVVLSYMETILQLMEWDDVTNRRLSEARMAFVPILNPVGVKYNLRSNGNGVDLMRNSPLDSPEGEDHRIFRGHRLGPSLPWYRGPKGGPMEIESQALLNFVRESILPAEISITVDVHSGFGAVDRLWFPFATFDKPFPYLAEVYSLKSMFDRAYPNHFYQIEPVSRSYTINGDLWDYVFNEYFETRPKNHFIPFTLEMGSWIWIRKSPFQVLNPLGIFHPMKPHRQKRVLRRHLTLFEFLHRSLISRKKWIDMTQEEREQSHQEAMELWYSANG